MDWGFSRSVGYQHPEIGRIHRKRAGSDCETEICQWLSREHLSTPPPQQLPRLNEMDISKLIFTATMLTVNKTQELETAVIAKQSRARYSGGPKVFEERAKPFRTFSGQCFRFKGAHMLRDCKTRQDPNQSVSDVVKQGIW